MNTPDCRSSRDYSNSSEDLNSSEAERNGCGNRASSEAADSSCRQGDQSLNNHGRDSSPLLLRCSGRRGRR